MKSSPPDAVTLRRDAQRRAYLAAVLARMASDPAEEARIRGIGWELLARKRRLGLIGRSHAERWERLLALPLPELTDILLAPGPDGLEMRHAHLLPAALPPEEINRIRQSVDARPLMP